MAVLLLLVAILLVLRGKPERQNPADAAANRPAVGDARTPAAAGAQGAPGATKSAAALEADRQIREE